MRRKWLAIMKNSIATVVPNFSAHRMVRDYVERCYVPASKRRH
jgi:starch phosphorylase